MTFRNALTVMMMMYLGLASRRDDDPALLNSLPYWFQEIKEIVLANAEIHACLQSNEESNLC
jgi:hypothetical protein